MKKQTVKAYILYICRWESSTVVLAPCLALLQGNIGVLPATIIGNAIGGLIFFWVDKLIFRKA